jgi:hypothetical protein
VKHGVYVVGATFESGRHHAAGLERSEYGACYGSLAATAVCARNHQAIHRVPPPFKALKSGDIIPGNTSLQMKITTSVGGMSIEKPLRKKDSK